MNTNKTTSRIGGVWCGGTSGCMAGLYTKGMSRIRECSTEREASRVNPVTFLAVDTDQATRTLKNRLGPEYPWASFSEDELVILPERKTSDLREALAQNENTRLYSERLAHARGSTAHGAGGEPMVGLAAILPDTDKMEAITWDKLKSQRDHKVLRNASRMGKRTLKDDKSLQLIFAFGGGGTGTSIALFLAFLIRKNAKLLGFDNTEVVLLLSTPSTTQGSDRGSKYGNLLYMARQISLAAEKPEKSVIHTFKGDLLIDRPLFDRCYIFGTSTGHMTLRTRDGVAATMAMAGWQLMNGSYQSSEAYFRDFEAESAAAGAFGPRIYARYGYSLVRFDQDFNKLFLAEAIRYQMTARLLKGESEKVRVGYAKKTNVIETTIGGDYHGIHY